MHDDETHIDVALVQQLVAEQFPALAGLPIQETQSIGTVNAMYRIGKDICARLPRSPAGAAALQREARWLPWLAQRLSLRIPEPVDEGRPSASYPFDWALYRWIDGAPYSDEAIDDEAQAARDLAQFVLELRRLDPSGAPPAGRKPLRRLDAQTRTAIEAASATIDTSAALAAWHDALETAAWAGNPVWIHTDLLRPNLLVESGRLCAVIDFGSAGAGDPAADVIAAWSVFGPTGRDHFRSALNVDDDTWRRARGLALHQAALIIPYYSKTNPPFAARAQRTIKQILLDRAQSG